MFKIIKRRTHINGYYSKIGSNRQNYYSQLILLILFAVGLTIGSFTVRSGIGDLLSNLLSLYRNYIKVKTEETVIVNFSNSFFKTLILLLFTYSAGLCAVGTPVLYTVPIVSGIGIGTISSYMYSSFTLKGIGYCALIVYPGRIIATVIMIASCTYSISMSTKMLKILTMQEDGINYKEYNIKYLILAAFTVLAALIDTVLNSLFSGYFNFQ